MALSGTFKFFARGFIIDVNSLSTEATAAMLSESSVSDLRREVSDAAPS